MSKIKENKIDWLVQRLLCECGGEFEHKFSVNYAPLPFTHVCSKCSVVEEAEYIYPRTVWEDA